MHYTELSEFCDRMFNETAVVASGSQLPDRAAVAQAPVVEVAEAPVADRVIVAARADVPLWEIGHRTAPLAVAYSADGEVLDRPDAVEPPRQEASGRQLQRSLRMEINSALVTAEPLACVTEENVYATPFKVISHESEDFDSTLSRYKHTRLHVAGAAYRQDGSLIHESRRPGGLGGDFVESIDPDHIVVPPLREEIRFPGTTLYLGNFMNHYGHFITEFLSKLWCVDEIRFDQIVIRPFIFQGGKALLFPFAKELLGVALPSGSQIRVVTGDACFERAVIPAQAWPINSNCNVAVRPLYATIHAHYRSGAPEGRIFLTRHQNTYKRITNLAEVERVAADFGFTIVNPETMPITDQMRLYANSQIIAGFGGTSLHNCLFSRPGTTVIELGDTRTRNRPHLMQSVAHAVSGVDMYHIPYRGTDDGLSDIESIRAGLANILHEIGEA
jgi:Glycosyltransferase 61